MHKMNLYSMKVLFTCSVMSAQGVFILEYFRFQVFQLEMFQPMPVQNDDRTI